jgi:hypothetical protein
MAYTTVTQIVQDIADALKAVNVAALPANWTNVAAEAQIAAYQDIVGRLLARGFTLAQITAWDRGIEFERAISKYYAFSSPQGAGKFDYETMRIWDRRKELDIVQVFTAGVFVSPGSTPGTVGVGGMNTSGDMFGTPFSDDDPRLGQTVRW